jgi:hypothetical protein
MRKLVLIAAMVLMSATAHAGVKRGLYLASTDEVTSTEQSKPGQTPVQAPADAPVEAPKYLQRPAAIDTGAPAPKAGEGKPVADRNIQPPKTAMPRHHRESTEARVIYELHRHGIYW